MQFKLKEPEKPQSEAARLLMEALQQEQRGNHKAAIERGALALNLIADEHDINGGGWS